MSVDGFVKGLVPFVWVLMACGGGGEGALPEEEPAAEAEEHAEEVHVEPESLEAWGLEVGPVGRTTVSAEVELPGVLTTNDNRTARIASLVEGQIAEIQADLGMRVARGQILASLNAPEFTRAQTAFLMAFAQAELSREDFRRAQALRESRALEEREFLRRQSLYEQHLAELRSAEVILHALGVDEDRLRAMTAGIDIALPLEDHEAVEALLPVRSPLAGVVLERDAVLGTHVEPGHALFTVSDLSTLWARLDAYEHQLPYLGKDADVVIRSPLFPGQDFPGRITLIADQVDPQLRTVSVRVEVPNPGGILKPNMYVQGFLRVREEGTERLVVPEDAVQLLEGEHVVFVEEEAEPGEDHRVFRAVHVTPGETLTVGKIILEGLDGTERIVTRGAFTLKAELTKGAGGHDHAH